MPLKNSQEVTSPLYDNVRRFRYILPIAAFVLVLIHQTLAYAWFRQSPGLAHFVWQVVLYGTVGPVVVWFALNWFAQWIRERDEAEAHLHCLYRISRQAATASEMESLIDIALSMPGEIISPVATSLILREFPESPWTLAGSHGLQAREEEMLAARLTIAGKDLYCGQCAALTATSHQNCPLQFHLPQADMLPGNTSIICLPLSTERPPLALLNVYLFGPTSLPTHKRRVLESTAAVLSVALDHARLRSREFQMLHRMEQATRQQSGLGTTLEHILADMATAHRAQAGEVFLTAGSNGEAGLVCVASWPEREMQPGYVSAAEQALLDEDTITMTRSGSREHVVAIPLTAEGQTRGVLVLASRHPFTTAQRAFLQVAASMVALVISNSQLYSKLERQAVLEERNRLAREVHDGLAQSLGFFNFKTQHLTRLLDHEQWPALRQGLEEMREALQNMYSEVRLTIQDLRWSLEDEQGLTERLNQYVTDFGQRAGLEAHFATQGQPHLSPRDEVHLFRIVQEALANVQKHAQAQKVWVRLSAGSEGTSLEVEDDGIGIPAASYPEDTAPTGGPGHFGLRIMQERAEAIGGQLSLHSVPGEGTRLQVSINAAHVLVAPSLSKASESH
jgi:signal transduction histidine kinase